MAPSGSHLAVELGSADSSRKSATPVAIVARGGLPAAQKPWCRIAPREGGLIMLVLAAPPAQREPYQLGDQIAVLSAPHRRRLRPPPRPHPRVRQEQRLGESVPFLSLR